MTSKVISSKFSLAPNSITSYPKFELNGLFFFFKLGKTLRSATICLLHVTEYERLSPSWLFWQTWLTLNQQCFWPHPAGYNREGQLSKKIKYHPEDTVRQIQTTGLNKTSGLGALWRQNYGGKMWDSLLFRDQRDTLNKCPHDLDCIQIQEGGEDSREDILGTSWEIKQPAC